MFCKESEHESCGDNDGSATLRKAGVVPKNRSSFSFFVLVLEPHEEKERRRKGENEERERERRTKNDFLPAPAALFAFLEKYFARSSRRA
jgi:hypothetical protein